MQLPAQTSFSGGNVATPTDWTNGLPSSGNNGTIAQAGVANSVFFNVASGVIVVSHTAGTLTGTPNLQNTGAAPVQWTQSGGTFSATNFFVVNNRVTYELTGTGLINFASVVGGSRLQVLNSDAALLQTGGTIDGIALAFENTTGISNLSGGVGLNLGASWPGGGAIRVLNSTVQITGDYTATINSGFINASGLGNGVLSMEGSGILDFSPTWTGSLSQTAFSGTTKWQTALTQTGVRVGGTQVTTENFGDYFSVVDNGVTVLNVGTSVTVGTRFIGSNVATPIHWTNGLPSPSNDGTIAQAGVANNVFFNVASGVIVVSHTAGTLTGLPNLQNTDAAPVQWTQSGGTFSATNFFVVNNRVTYELSGTGLINFASVTGGSRLQVVNAGGAFLQTGGTIDGVALAFENTTGISNLSGGVGLNLGASWAGGGAIRVLNSTVQITGDYTATINSGFSNAAGLGNGVLSMEGSGVLDFSPTWTGSLTQTAFNGTTKWQDALTQTGVRVGGTQVTTENFGDYFSVVDNGVTVITRPFDAWAASFNLVGNAALPGADPDNDGLSNLLEFAFGSDPTVSDAGSLTWNGTNFTPGSPVVHLAYPNGGGVDFTARFIRRTDHGTSGSAACAWQFSSDLSDWEANDDTPARNWLVAPTVLATDGDYQLMEVPYPLFLDSGKKARYFRIEVTATP